MNSFSQLMIAAPSSNSGKTTVTLGLLQALQKRNLSVQPFKCGPDYIDTYLHTKAAGRQSINLDLFLSSPAHLRQLYNKYASGSSVAVVESVMGLFDGAIDESTSSATIAKTLGIPVILVVDARSMASSAGALIYGFKNFDPEIKLAGVIFNFVSSESHYIFLKEACIKAGAVPLGYLPPNKNIAIPDRYLGLNISNEIDFEEILNEAAHHVEQHLDIDKLLEITSTAPISCFTPNETVEQKKLKIAVARDEAFNFTYHENLEKLKVLGEVNFFSPLHDTHLPEADLVYLSGGYPEKHLTELSSNYRMLLSVQDFCKKGGNVLAECGGMMYLGEEIVDENGDSFPMVNFLPISTSMAGKKLHLGYRTLKVDGLEMKGHEFHYSNLIIKGDLEQIGEVFTARNQIVQTPFFKKRNTYASYIHFYWGENGVTFKSLFHL